ncbi:hypothetical protein P344_04645 [Spiroplasma mirum ATCC 29335]|uniref:AAA+ ATPase domain-containing protein n=1 Tax=Spiroplasma mirum ATCC 29335 TaxID=838561 RepID=W0GLR2_9MOLU|nr:replication-associated recombination protein A [Spiroplasma mirum]AHF61180.1 recombination factor protein RarA [Spiroplasma mirum ATCC 29335]AHI58251.1 hypothetical protein P344_04645 [Spiroplasma mirum ATCC 29335]
MQQPLSFLWRPQSLQDVIGQEHLINDQNGILSRMIKNNFVSSLIFYGNPGIGKTSIALALANDLKIEHSIFNAAIDKKSDLEKIIKKAENYDRYILVLEEIHRMNRDRQDILLQYLEHGNLIMFACTIENPFFVINPAIRSRSNIIELKPISAAEMFSGLKRSLQKSKDIKLNITDEALSYICNLASGDLRVAINILELAIHLYPQELVNLDIVKAISPTANLLNSHYGDEHHHLKSAFQKSIRGSDVEAALHYFSRLLASGDYEALLRRMLIISYEDIGLANPAISLHVKAAIDSFRQIGMPEGIIPLGLVVIEMCLSEKSNSAYLATFKAYEDVIMNGKVYPVPLHLRDASYKSAKKLNRGLGYKYPHDFPNDYVKQQYLPNKLLGTVYYHPKLHSVYEKRLNDLYQAFKNKK